MTGTRRDELARQFRRYHRDHPEVYDLVKRFTFDRIHKGFKNYSINSIFERIRWETATPKYGVREFKLSNNHRAFYARLFMKDFPQYGEFFRLRRQTSRDQPAGGFPPLTPQDFGDSRGGMMEQGSLFE